MTRRRPHLIANAKVEKVTGIALLLAAAALLHDAYERRAKDQPLWLRPLSWW